MDGASAKVFDAAVVGAGPAGASAAAVLARAGLRVCIVEKDKLPRYKTCGGGVLWRAAKLLPVEISGAVERECRIVRLHIDEELSFQSSREAAMVSMVMRDAFDEMLVKDAVKYGAKLSEPARVTGIETRSDYVKLATSKGPLEARFVIGADGANSEIARLLKWRDGRNLIPAIECEVWAPTEVFSQLYEEARFDFGGIESGYGWVFPKREHLSIGVLTVRPGAVSLNENLAWYLRRLKIPETARMERHGYVIPLSPRSGKLAAGRVLLVGDAAGLADPVTAEGITHAILSGQKAAECIVRSLNRGAEAVIDEYNNWVDSEMRSELAAARKLAKFLYLYPRLRRMAFKTLGGKLVEGMTRVVMGEIRYRDVNLKAYAARGAWSGFRG